VQAEYHLSLSRTVAVRAHQIQPLLADLRAGLSGAPRHALPYLNPTPPARCQRALPGGGVDYGPAPQAWSPSVGWRLPAPCWRCTRPGSSSEPVQRAPTLHGAGIRHPLGPAHLLERPCRACTRAARTARWRARRRARPPRRFSVELGPLEAFANDERSRAFLALGVAAGAAEARPGRGFRVAVQLRGAALARGCWSGSRQAEGCCHPCRAWPLAARGCAPLRTHPCSAPAVPATWGNASAPGHSRHRSLRAHSMTCARRRSATRSAA